MYEINKVIMAQMTVKKFLALQVAVGTTFLPRGPSEVTKLCLQKDHPLQLLTLAVETGGEYERVKRLYALFIQKSKIIKGNSIASDCASGVSALVVGI